MPRLKGSADLLEDRRKRALALLDAGESLNEVGRRIGCNPSSVMRWRDARRRGGANALRVRSSPGPLKLDRAQRRRLVNLLLQGPMMHGYRTNLWTTARIAELIWNQFGIQYHRDHVGRLMHSLNWSPQKPERRALERDENAIARWQQKDWPRIKKRYAAGCPPSLRRRIGLSFDSLCGKTWSPQGCTPVHYHRQRRRDKVSVISGISVSTRRQRLGLYYQLYFDNIGQDEVCLSLRELLRHLRGSVIVLLDNSSTRQGAPLQQLLRQHSRLHIEHFPSYAPELNPDEGVWSLAKRALANSCPNDVEELVEDVIGSINRIRISTQKLRGCILQSGLPSFLR